MNTSHQAGYERFGIDLPDRSGEAIDAAVRRVEEAGGQLLDRRARSRVPYAYVTDVDGYTSRSELAVARQRHPAPEARRRCPRDNAGQAGGPWLSSTRLWKPFDMPEADLRRHRIDDRRRPARIAHALRQRCPSCPPIQLP